VFAGRGCCTLFSNFTHGRKEMIVVAFLWGIIFAMLLDYILGKRECKKYHDLTKGK
jgi:uncharacterized membrane protein affecting hemolysin expression